MSSAHPVPPTGATAIIWRGSARPMKPPCFTPYLIARGILGSRWITEEITDVVPVLHSPCILALSLDWRSLCLGRWNAAPGARPLAPPGRAHRRSAPPATQLQLDRKSTRLNSSHVKISYAVFCLKKKKKKKKKKN